MNRVDITNHAVTCQRKKSFYAEASDLQHGQGVTHFNQDLVLFNPNTGNERHFKYLSTHYDLRGEELRGWDYAHIVNGRHEMTLHVYND